MNTRSKNISNVDKRNYGKMVRESRRRSKNRGLLLVRREGEKVWINIELIKPRVNSIKALLKVTPREPEARSIPLAPFHRIKQVKFMFKMIPIKFLLVFPSKGKTTSFIILTFNHVKIASQNLGDIGEIIKPIPQSDPIFHLIGSVNGENSKGGTIKVYYVPSHMITGGVARGLNISPLVRIDK